MINQTFLLKKHFYIEIGRYNFFFNKKIVQKFLILFFFLFKFKNCIKKIQYFSQNVNVLLTGKEAK